MNKYDSNEIAEACMNADISDSQYESLMLELRNAPIGPAQQPEATAGDSVDTTNFWNLVGDYLRGTPTASAASSALIAHIDAWHAAGVAAEHEFAKREGWNARGILNQEAIHQYRARAEKAEAERDEARRKLAEHLAKSPTPVKRKASADFDLPAPNDNITPE